MLFVPFVAMIVLAACFNGSSAPAFIKSSDCTNLDHGALPITDVALSADARVVTVQAEVANSSSERAQGLMCRESIPAGTGMLFTYASDRTSGFWMYNTYVPIDILYIGSSGDVVDMISMSPCPRGSANDDEWKLKCATEASEYVPTGTWRYTLELPSGWLAENGITDSIARSMSISWSGIQIDG